MLLLVPFTKFAFGLIQLAAFLNVRIVFAIAADLCKFVGKDMEWIDRDTFAQFVNTYIARTTLAEYFSRCTLGGFERFDWSYFERIFNPAFGYTANPIIPSILAVRALMSEQTDWLLLFYSSCHIGWLRIAFVYFKLLTASKASQIRFVEVYHGYFNAGSLLALSICNRELASGDHDRISTALDAMPRYRDLAASSERLILSLLASNDARIVDRGLYFLLNSAKYVSSASIRRSVRLLGTNHPDKDIVKLAQRVLEALALNQKIKP